MNELIKDFPITVYGNLEKYNEVISKGRCRIFYKGANRNGSYITEEFASKLIKTIPYTPVKGIYDEDSQDFIDHGSNRNLGRIYGVVPADPKFAWEKHQDDDGVEREYACVDVLYYTGLYKEAGEIAGKAQSMEIYSDSIKGDWKAIDGKKYFVFEDACFLGLQALGTDVEPCFEGAAFYNLFSSMKEFINEINNYKTNFQKDGQGGKVMPEFLFKLSDQKKCHALWAQLNSTADENGFREIAYSICDVYDDYAIAYNHTDDCYERIYYTKDDTTDQVEILSHQKCFIIDVSESEKAALDAMVQMNGGNFEKVDEVFSSVEALKNEVAELNAKNEELNNNIASLNAEKENIESQLNDSNSNYAKAQEQIESISAEKDALSAYKKEIENNAKLAVINNYADSLSEELLENYRAGIDNFTCEELDMKLTYEQKKANPTMFSKHTIPAYIPKDNEQKSGIELILSRYEKK